MFALGLSPRLKKDRAWYKNIEITMQTYTHIGYDLKIKTDQLIDDELFDGVVNS